MSIRIMSHLWENGPTDGAELLVMLALADIANDDGVCWPSMDTIGKRARMSERNARRVIRKLEDEGWIRTEPGRGRNVSNVYRILKTGQSDRADNLTGRTNEAEKPDICDIKPDTAMSGEPSRNHKRTISRVVAPQARDEVTDILSIYASATAAKSFADYRKRVRKPLTLTAAKRLGENLRAIQDGGGDPDDALGMAEERGWQTIKPDWYFRERAGHGQRGFAADEQPDRTLRLIAAAARAR